MDNIAAALLLNSINEISGKRFKELIDVFGSPKAVFDASESELRKINILTAKLIYKIQRARLNEDIQNIIDVCAHHNFFILYYGAKEYPENIKELEAPPCILYSTGQFKKNDANAIAVVGSRYASKYATRITEKITKQLVDEGLTIVSGFAKGIDIIAHNTAVENGGRTVCVVATGLLRKYIYPFEHKYYYDKYINNPNVIFLSEYPPETAAAKQNFPARNRIISGLSLGTFVAQAGKKSGALITADMALEQNREVFAAPDRIDSNDNFGANELIKTGRAKLVQSTDDILEELNLNTLKFNKKESVKISSIKYELSPNEKKVLSVLTDAPRKITEIAAELEMTENAATIILLQLELKNIICQLPGHLYFCHKNINS